MAQKGINLVKCNLYLQGYGRDVNGNSIVKLFFPNSRGFSIQINGDSLKNTYSLLRGRKTLKEIEKLSYKDLSIISSEIVSYVKKYGSETQKKKLNIY